jgi:TM2 domain-containing membrane protein YozV
MANIDRAKDFINNIRLYMTIIVAIILSMGSGTAKMYNAGNFNYLFYAANSLLLIFMLIFALLARFLHKKTDDLKDIK